MIRRAADILFADDFDDPAPLAAAAEPELEPEALPALFTLEELEAARQAAHQAGREDALAGLAAARAQVLERVAAAVEAGQDAAREVAHEAAERIGRTLMSAICTVLPLVCERNGEAELRLLARHVLPLLQDEPAITLRACPAQAVALEEDCASLGEEIARRVTVAADPAIPPGDVRIAWRGAVAVRDAGAAAAAIRRALAELDLLEPPPSEKDCHA